MTLYICFGLCGLSFSVGTDYIRLCLGFISFGTVAYNFEDCMINAGNQMLVMTDELMFLKEYIKENLPEKFDELFSDDDKQDA